MIYKPLLHRIVIYRSPVKKAGFDVYGTSFNILLQSRINWPCYMVTHTNTNLLISTGFLALDNQQYVHLIVD